MLQATTEITTHITYKAKSHSYNISFICKVEEDTYHAIEALLDYVDEKYKKPSIKDLRSSLLDISEDKVSEEYSSLLFSLMKKLKSFSVT